MKSISKLNEELAEAKKYMDCAQEAMYFNAGNPRKYISWKKSSEYWRGEFFKIESEIKRRAVS